MGVSVMNLAADIEAIPLALEGRRSFARAGWIIDSTVWQLKTPTARWRVLRAACSMLTEGMLVEQVWYKYHGGHAICPLCHPHAASCQNSVVVSLLLRCELLTSLCYHRFTLSY